MKFTVKNYPHREQEFIAPDEIGDMFLYLTSLMNSLDVNDGVLGFGAAMGRFTIEIERTE